jgi:hypothetical protein
MYVGNINWFDIRRLLGARTYLPHADAAAMGALLSLSEFSSFELSSPELFSGSSLPKLSSPTRPPDGSFGSLGFFLLPYQQ